MSNWELFNDANGALSFLALATIIVGAILIYKLVDTVSYNVARVKEAKYTGHASHVHVAGFGTSDDDEDELPYRATDSIERMTNEEWASELDAFLGYVLKWQPQPIPNLVTTRNEIVGRYLDEYDDARG